MRMPNPRTWGCEESSSPTHPIRSGPRSNGQCSRKSSILLPERTSTLFLMRSTQARFSHLRSSSASQKSLNPGTTKSVSESTSSTASRRTLVSPGFGLGRFIPTMTRLSPLQGGCRASPWSPRRHNTSWHPCYLTRNSPSTISRQTVLGLRRGTIQSSKVWRRPGSSVWAGMEAYSAGWILAHCSRNLIGKVNWICGKPCFTSSSSTYHPAPHATARIRVGSGFASRTWASKPWKLHLQGYTVTWKD